MTWTEYTNYFDEILKNPAPSAPYDHPDYLNYTKLNHARTNRWLKHGEIMPEIKDLMASIKENQKWILITEPWCGDAAHSVPFIKMISDLSDKVTLEIQLRDTDSEIDNYTTNGGKAIPKLIVRNEEGMDLAIWGPRPAACQEVFDLLKTENADFEQQKIALQKWYNEDNGHSIQVELNSILFV